ncbi:uncharacterized protein LOC114325103 isoform X2 [Diabrotica virgifera virgifera]|uniref:Uncharacterized protein LOC114325103 isoform X2 n=1 Tax=Diabrotica virgifera virgifera TaxID=50390 RepID=A0A6P7EZW0_DIAVI|nr:uncharacterized protein LOC114325103 isoform X2 [Diabrotica virgifera virgifera]
MSNIPAFAQMSPQEKVIDRKKKELQAKLAIHLNKLQAKISRHDRFAQMSQQEKVIEQKKREIQAKLEAKQASKVDTKVKADSSSNEHRRIHALDKYKDETGQYVFVASSKPASKQIAKSTDLNTNGQQEVKNTFFNDGSFLNQFKQMKEAKKTDSKLKYYGSSKLKGKIEKSSSDDRNKLDRQSSHHRSPSPKDRQPKRVSRFDKLSNFEPKITISTAFSSALAQAQAQEPQQPTYEITSINISTQDVTGQPLLKNVLPAQTVTFQTIPEQTAITETVISASPVLLNIPPPQLVQGSNTLVLSQAPPTQNVLVSAPILTTVNLPPSLVTANLTPVPAPCGVSTVELANIPPPNPIQIQNIPQPEPLNALTIPQPAPIQVQNIPTPTSLHLNKIPTPKPLDLLSIPTPCEDGGIPADFLKNIPPPNKSIPPPLIHENQILLQQSHTGTATITVPSTQNVLIHTIPQSNSLDSVQPAFSSVTVALPVVVGQVTTAPAVPNNIPSLMAQPVLPPPGMVNVNVTCPPPLFNAPQVQTFLNQPPPMANQMPVLNIPPPGSIQMLEPVHLFKDITTGTPEYEAMASLGRMVAECGDTFEDVVRQRKEQDPRLWFLFDKESEAYKLYRKFVDQVKREIMAAEQRNVRPEDKYEPEMALEEDGGNMTEEREGKERNANEKNSDRKRKRKSRWGNQEANVPPPTLVFTPPMRTMPVMNFVPPPPANTEPVLLSKITRNDPGLIQYALNTYRTATLSEEDWKKAEENYKVSLLYQDVLKKQEEAKRLKLAGHNKYEYDSDEETDGGTWEHKQREKEMMTTQSWAEELTKRAEGKHHIGDFLPPDEFKKFMEKVSGKGQQPLSESDYKEFQLKEDNIGFKMLQKLGWSQGEGLGSGGMGIVEPINKGPARAHIHKGLGVDGSQEDEDEYQTYRKRMMLAYRFRPNPFNNPRRPYY